MTDPAPTEALTEDGSAAETGRAGRVDPGDSIASGTRLGRYVVLTKLGAGGMGVVFAAYDPELDRKVAIKLIHGGEREAARAHLAREAQALAKLSDARIVAVYDVGSTGDHVWLAMEFIDGQTLRVWSEAQSRSWREILAVLVDAGRGLAAAHAVGLVHRDFKPDNAMIGRDGRVRVMDFGIARWREQPSDDLAGVDESLRSAVPPAEATLAGTVQGTPDYMAPEQHARQPSDARADQFAWCVTAWEALFGERPFAGTTQMERISNLLAGRVRSPPAGAGVPAWLRRAIARGLSTDPQMRWPSMDALLDEVARGHARTRRRRIALALAGVAVIGLGILGARALDHRRRIADCEQTDGERSAHWDDGVRARVDAALRATGVGHAGATADKVTARLDDYAASWQRARTRVCIAGDVERSLSDAAVERALWCLDERRMELDALVAELVGIDPKVVHFATIAAAGLPAVEPCEDAEMLARLPTPPVAHREEIRAIRAELAAAGARQRAGAYDAALVAIDALIARAEALQWPPLLARLRISQGAALERTGAYEAAERAFTAAYFDAANSGSWDLVAGASAQLVTIVGLRLGRVGDAATWGRHGELALANLGATDGLLEARLAHNLALLRRDTGDTDGSLALFERALAIHERIAGPEHPDVAVVLTNVAIAHHDRGDLDRAEELLDRALELREQVFGPDHPEVALDLDELAKVVLERGDRARARALQERALAIREDALGPGHPMVGTSLNNLAHVLIEQGDRERARDLFQRAAVVQEAALGADHPHVAASLNNLGFLLVTERDFAAARPLLERAVAIVEAAKGPDHRDLVMILDNLGTARRGMGELRAGLELHERALAIAERTWGASDRRLAETLGNLAEVHAALGDDARAQQMRARLAAIQGS